MNESDLMERLGAHRCEICKTVKAGPFRAWNTYYRVVCEVCCVLFGITIRSLEVK